MPYRELHVDSAYDGRTSGDESHPKFNLNDPLYIKKFALKSVQIPITFPNIFEPSQLTLTLWEGGVDTYQLAIFIPEDYYTADSLVEWLNLSQDQWVPLPAGAPTSTTFGPYSNIVFSVSADNQLNIACSGTSVPSDFISLGISTVNYDIFLKMMGYDPPEADLNGDYDYVFMSDVATVAGGDFNGELKFQPPNYLMMRSSLARGARFLANIRGPCVPNNTSRSALGNYSSSNIIAKIPLDNGATSVYNSYYLFSNQDPSPETMFDYDGEYIDEFDLYFTYPNSDKKVDFNGYNFTTSFGIIA